MGIRIKLLLPLLVFSLLFVSFLKFNWEPKYKNSEFLHHREHIEAHLITLADALAISLISNDIENIYSTLDAVLSKSEGWIALELFGVNGDLLYPFQKNIKGDQGVRYWDINSDIIYLNKKLGRITLQYNNLDLFEHIQSKVSGIYAGLGIFVLIFLSGLALSIEFKILRPVSTLSAAARKLSKGEFVSLNESKYSDEVGTLVNAFISMSSNIKLTHESLKKEINDRSELYNKLEDRSNELEEQKLALDQHSIVSVADSNNMIVYVNNKFCDISGYTSEELIGLNQFMLMDFDTPEENFDAIYKTIHQGQVWKGELVNLTKEKKYFTTETTIVPFVRGDSPPYQYVAIQTDVSALKKAKDSIKIQSNQYQLLMDSSPTVMMSCDPSGDFNIHFVSNNVNQILGYLPEQLINDNNFWHDHIHPGDRDLIFSNLTDLFVNGIYENDCRFRHRLGNYLWVNTQMRLITDSKDEPHLIIVSLTDITQRKQINDSLKAISSGISSSSSDSFFYKLVKYLTESLGIAYAFVYKIENNDKSVGKIVASCYQGKVDNNTYYDFSGSPCQEVVTNKDIKLYPAKLQVLFPDNSGLSTMGATSYLGIPFFSRTGEMLGHLAIMDVNTMPLENHIIDICILFASRAAEEMERQIIHDELKRKESILQLAQSLANVGSWEWIINDDALKWSDQQYRLFGFEPEEVVPDFELFISHVHPDYQKEVTEAVQSAIKNKTPYEIYFKILREDGEIRDVYDHGKVFYDNDGNPVYMSGALQDITDQKQVEQTLIEYRDHLQDMVDEQTSDLVKARDDALMAERAMSDFLANMTHELRTPLHGILSFSGFGMKKVESAPKEKLYGYFSDINNCGLKLLKLVTDLLDLSSLRAGNFSYLFDERDICEIVKNVCTSFVAVQQERNISINITGEKHFLLTVDDQRITQVVRNLLDNALKFSPDNSRIDISIVQIENNKLSVMICDQGVGIPEDELSLIFDAFSQSSNTKTGAGGKGLGLVISREIIENGHHGKLRAENRPDGGVCITFELPVSS